MKKILGLLLMFLLIHPIVPFAKQVEGGSKVNTLQKQKKKKVVKKQRIRTAQNINKPKEGEVLKIEGMVKDINEQ